LIVSFDLKPAESRCLPSFTQIRKDADSLRLLGRTAVEVFQGNLARKKQRLLRGPGRRMISLRHFPSAAGISKGEGRKDSPQMKSALKRARFSPEAG